ncbi:YggS family pyridoxal phosphate-dependent enzyme [Alkalicaulis satelles]|uniref:Pyridoxal phosphate homeostasis protein n=1 Tax=Alkalicaulis satelles TaxID=2609175 RepID=A0A5M6ZC03_9PROT|nr:YggS family pyridoxal phosphate-dependent enzyme [Alkalicaulis satelles]KAA5802242.1 YggS family pyridoxal phosphate-dependent enzyme [Alkalicaulis satelles]
MDDLASRLAQSRAAILERINAAAKAGGRPSGSVTLTAVSKQQPDERIEAMLAAGQRVFGENRVQEAQARWEHRRGQWPDLELRLIGPLQTNKADAACALFDVIETLDRDKLASALARAMDKTGRRPRLFIQVNTGREAQKAGIDPGEAAAFAERCRETHGLAIEGLMCIPPEAEPASLHFALLAQLARDCSVERLSMGMSADYELAARMGASAVRVGSALFGARPGPAA